MAALVLTRQIKIAGTGYTGAVDETINILPGTLSIQDKDDHRGGEEGLPRVKVSIGTEGSFQTLVQSSTTSEASYPKLTELMGYVSAVGEGKFVVTDMTQAGTPALAKDALLDIRIVGQAVQIAEFVWKGTNY